MSFSCSRGRTSRRLAPLALVLVSSAPLAQPRQLDPVVVSATRTPLRVSEAVGEVSVIDRVMLDRAAGRTLVEVLASQPGLQFTSTGGLGKTASVFIRGLEARHTLLLLDGVRVSSETVGSPSLDNIPLEIVDRIEIVRGPMSSLYGSGAFGGVIQVFTRRGREGLHPNAALTVGSNRYGQAAAGIAFGQGPFDAAVQLQHTETRGFSATNERAQFGSFNADRDSFRQTGGSVRLGWQVAPDWRVEGLAVESNGKTQYDDGPGADARAALRNSILLVQVNGRVTAEWRTRFYVSRALDAYDTLASASPWAELGAISTVHRQFGWENTLVTPLGTALVLLEHAEHKVAKPGAPFDVDERDVDALALGLNGSAGAHTWQASLRHDRNSQFGDRNNGALGWGYLLAPGWRLGASLGTSFVAPSFNQLYYPGFGNPDLQPEEGKHAELSLRWTSGEHNLRVAWFDNRYRNFIPSGPLPSNVPKARADGFALSWEGRVGDVALGASYDHVDPRNATAGAANVDKQLPRRAKNALKLNADWQTGAWSAGATVAAYSERYDDAANTLRLGGYGTLDLRAEWALRPEWSIGVRVNNVGGKAYETAWGYNQAGREGFLTLRYAPR